MDAKEKAQLCDKVLDKFRGNKTFLWKEIIHEDFYASLHSNVYVIENIIYFLLSENAIVKEWYIPTQKYNYKLTPKGMAILGDHNESYMAKYHEKKKQHQYSSDAMHYAQWAMWASIIGIGISILIAVFQSK